MSNSEQFYCGNDLRMALTNGEVSSQCSSDLEDKRSRSVNDFDTEKALRRALRDGKKRSSFVSWAVPSEVHYLDGVLETEEDEEFEDEDFDSDLENMLDNEHDPSLDWVISNLDKETSVEQSLDEELNRLKVLRSYLILDAERESSFERLTALAGRMFQVPIALISLVDLGRQWFMSNRGLGDVRETPRKLAFCAHAILSTQDLLIVPDATKDPRFYDSPLVLGPPDIRFYAGAPLISPEGVKLGTFCIIDTKTRPDGLTLPEKQNLRELAAMVIDTMVERRREKRNSAEDRSQLIACTAHDLLTPLSGVQMSVSLLLEDELLMSKLDSHQKELVETAANCTEVMGRICHETIETFRGEMKRNKTDTHARRVSLKSARLGADSHVARSLKGGEKAINLASLVKNITMVMDPYPKEVPLYITVDPSLPKEFISHDLKVFRSIINYLTNACKHTTKGCVHLKIYRVQKQIKAKGNKKKLGKPTIVFEVEDTGKGIKLEQYSSLFRPFREDDGTSEPDPCILVDEYGNLAQSGAMCTPEMETPGLGLYSVATNIGSIGGEYGFRPRDLNSDEHYTNLKSGSVFWFSIPLIEPTLNDQVSHIDLQQNAPASPVSVEDVAPVLISAKKKFDQDINKARIKVVVCSKLPADAKCSKKSLTFTRRATRTLCAGTWNNDESDAVSLDRDKSIQADHNSFKVLTTNNLNEADADHVCDVLASALKPESDSKSTNKSGGITHKTRFPALSPTVDLNLHSQPPDIPARKRRALIIDDSLVIRKSIGRALSTMGYDVSQATNGMEGLKELQSAMFDVVLCDFLMPVMDGLDCIQQYRAWEESHRPWLRQYIIGISAHANPRDVERGIACGMNSFLPKPLPIQVLRELQTSDDINKMSAKLDELNEKREIPLSPENENVFVTDPSPENGLVSVHEDKGKSVLVNVNSDVPLFTAKELSEDDQPICLIAEDSKSVSKVLKRAIEGQGWRTISVEDGEEALRLLKTRNWDAVFMDDEMPMLNGTQCIDRFRVWEKQNRVASQKNVIFMSGNYIPPPPGAETSCAAFPKGFNGAIPKPVVLKDLYSFLKSASRSVERKSSDIMHR